MPRGIPNQKSDLPEDSTFVLDDEELADIRKARGDYENALERYYRRKEEDPKLKIKPPREYDISVAFGRVAFLKAKKLGYSSAIDVRKTEAGIWVATGVK